MRTHPHAPRHWAVAAGLLTAAWAAAFAYAKAEKQVSPDPGRTAAIHRIPLFDEENAQIKADAKGAKPFSLKVSCNKCHDYEKVSGGWHFNAADPKVDAGRPGEPWLHVDIATGTQVPVSRRPWPGAQKPAAFGLTPWKLVQAFGRHMPGGGFAERIDPNIPDPTSRWEACGSLEINCLGCHNADSRQDQSFYADQIERENIRWAATAGSGLAYVTGYLKGLPNYDPLLGEAPDNPQFVPRVEYHPGQFNSKGEVYVNVVRKAQNDRCYYCHTNHPTDLEEWQVPEDIHVARGLKCTDCHFNGLDHKISRNYEGEQGVMKGLTCRGCHLGEDQAGTQALRKGGHAAAPRPLHAGLPQLHLDKISCTACHSGPWPLSQPQRVQTSRAHGLGHYLGIHYNPAARPVIQEPVFVKQYDGKIAPHRMVFPAFWGRRKDGTVEPIAPEAVVAATGKLMAMPKDTVPRRPTAETVAEALKALGTDKKAGEAVYISGGKLRRLDAGGKVVAEDHAAAAPYSWPLAHEVRPAAQSLGYGGAEGCAHCHSTDSPFLFGKVAADSPVSFGPEAAVEMNQFAGQDGAFHKLFAMTFIFRPWLKAFGFAAVGVIVLVLLAYGLPAVRAALGGIRRRAREP